MAQPEEKPERYTGETLPAWSLPAAASAEIGIGVEWPERVTPEWALGGSTGAGIRVCILDSGVQPDHPLVGALEGAVALRKTEDAATGRAARPGDTDSISPNPPRVDPIGSIRGAARGEA